MTDEEKFSKMFVKNKFQVVHEKYLTNLFNKRSKWKIYQKDKKRKLKD